MVQGEGWDARDTQAMSASELRQACSACSFEDMPALAQALRVDRRSSVRDLAKGLDRRYERERRVRDHTDDLYDHMRQLGGPGLVLGLDEVGRGSVAGPLLVAAVALPDRPEVWGIDDSKKLTPARREELAAQIAQVATAIGFGWVEPADIDACGMAASLRVAMTRAIADAGVEPDSVLIDGMPVHVHPREQTVVHGDGTVACIAAASIVAKVTRDALMIQADASYPGYFLAESKGYASPDHIAAIRERGLTPFHRASFCQNFLTSQG